MPVYYLAIRVANWRTEKIKRNNADRKSRDSFLIHQLSQQAWAKNDFKQIEILGKTCLYNEDEKGVVKFIKIKNEKIRIGKLYSFHNNPEFIDFTARLDTLTDQENYEAFGSETGFFFREIEYKEKLNWREEYNLFDQDELNTKIKDRFENITLNTYVNMIKSLETKTEKY